MLYSDIAGFERSCHSSCINRVYCIQNKRIDKHKQTFSIRETRPYLRSYLRTNSRFIRKLWLCAKKASSSGPAAALTSKTQTLALKPVSITNLAMAMHSPGHTAPRSRYIHPYGAPRVYATMKPRHSKRPTKPFSPSPLHTQLSYL